MYLPYHLLFRSLTLDTTFQTGFVTTFKVFRVESDAGVCACADGTVRAAARAVFHVFSRCRF